jgi:hypothetical protein
MRKNKIYIMLVILTTIFLFTTAAVCNQSGTPIETKIVTEEDKGETEEKEEIKKELEEVTEETEEEIEELKKEELGSDQKRIVSLFGHPDKFTVIFDESNNNKRIDIWIYSDMDALFVFENGTYNDTEQYYGEGCQESEYELLPQDFIYGMTLLEVETLIGQEGAESIEENTGLNILIFGEAEITCIFNPDNKLIIASKQNKILNEI